MNNIQPYPWPRLTLAAVALLGIALTAILAMHFSDSQIEESRHRLIVGATGFPDVLEHFFRGRGMFPKTPRETCDTPAF